MNAYTCTCTYTYTHAYVHTLNYQSTSIMTDLNTPSSSFTSITIFTQAYTTYRKKKATTKKTTAITATTKTIITTPIRVRMIQSFYWKTHQVRPPLY